MLGDLYVKGGRIHEAKGLYERSLADTDLAANYREAISQRLDRLR